MAAFRAWDKLALEEGTIPKKYKELIAIGVALTTQCPYCIDTHRQEALKAGAREEELTEGSTSPPLYAPAVRSPMAHIWWKVDLLAPKLRQGDDLRILMEGKPRASRPQPANETASGHPL